MSSVTTRAADLYQYVVEVDTHAATHSYAIVSAASDEASFPAIAAALCRARPWINRRTHSDLETVLVAAKGTGFYGAKLAGVLAEGGYRVVEAPTPAKQRGRAKTDGLDALSAARSTLSMPVDSLRDRRAGEIHDALQVLSSARDHLNVERLRPIKHQSLSDVSRLNTRDIGTYKGSPKSISMSYRGHSAVLCRTDPCVS